jgi:hypothetical protein
VWRPADGISLHRLDRRGDRIIHVFDREAAFSQLRCPPGSYKKRHVGAALLQHATLIAAQRSRADDQEPHDRLPSLA